MDIDTARNQLSLQNVQPIMQDQDDQDEQDDPYCRYGSEVDTQSMHSNMSQDFSAFNDEEDTLV